MTPKPPEWIDVAPVKVRSSREMLASPEEVWATLVDHRSWVEWFDAIRDVEPRGEPATGLGSKRRIKIQNKITLDEEFIIWEPDKSWGFTVFEASGPFPRIANSLNERVDIEALAPDRVRVTYLMGWDPKPGRTFLFKRVLKGGLRKKLNAALAELSRYIERNRTVERLDNG